tara:strand:- start:52 stop:357 length:306 start_codon:yes stop_codon:yes gene_type:complete
MAPSSNSSSLSLFEDQFNVSVMNPEGKKFESVNRVQAVGLTYGVNILLDVNCDLFKCKVGEGLSICLASTLDLDGGRDDGVWDQRGETNLANNYEYVMYGE